ncbi:energy transducer TonB [Biformimicrobium ophioploci]|uniref:Energy transducer TonB n=1 Tax=Biformimicrobium ophioploci TaxID=3036711 RepID=A0ABQ6LV27_9GAMM|nr:energy transducer TonB [Microbulbifer sp. NKW57]GMG85912.1 energy transducer TonB [Microbulbifer sp. NKW57]
MTHPQDTAHNDRFVFALFLAGAFHAAVILGVTFKLPEVSKSSPTLEVTLAQHSVAEAQQDADYLAQHNQEASGTAEDPRELSTTRRAEIADTQIREINPAPQQMASRQADNRVQLVTTTGESERNAPEMPAEDRPSEEQQGDAAQDLLLMNPEIASLQARLDKIRQNIAQRPRVRRLTSVATRASADAAYLHAWREKIESVGNENFPKEALQRSITGKLRLLVRLLPNGAVEEITVLESSGQRIFDDAARQIVRLAAPFQPFPKEIRKDTDRLEIIRTWHFQTTGLVTAAARAESGRG